MVVSYVLNLVLVCRDFDSRIVVGKYTHPAVKRRTNGTFRSHIWVEVGQTIYDLTLTQFEPDAPRVAVIERPDSRFEAVHEPDVGCVLAHLQKLYRHGELEHFVMLAVKNVAALTEAAAA